MGPDVTIGNGARLTRSSALGWPPYAAKSAGARVAIRSHLHSLVDGANTQGAPAARVTPTVTMEPKAKARLSFASTPLGPKPAEEPPAREALDQTSLGSRAAGAFHTGDHAAFAALLSRYQRPVFNFVLRSLGERQVAEDLTQEVFLRVIQGGAGFQSQSKFSTWLFTIARNLCVDHTRRMKHRKHASLDASTNPDAKIRCVWSIASRITSPAPIAVRQDRASASASAARSSICRSNSAKYFCCGRSTTCPSPRSP